ncbi:hypothetical protein JCGZ_07373 [Jatropha curcas]|uniref:Uncharacterized protein n=1 Tax=Jatropha curcas TaxID=180498 RepID=A0A067KCF3_JATCU|nr:hypothetical protein JCGZ_07373 [Jatropha curcas]
MNMGKTAPEQKRRKLEPPPRRRTAPSQAGKVTGDATSVSSFQVPITPVVDYRFQQAKHFAVAQAQQEGCTGNFRISDSPFGNFLVPVIPTRAELKG